MSGRGNIAESVAGLEEWLGGKTAVEVTAVFMVMWWALVEDLHECAVKLGDNYPPFLGTLRHYRERAQIQFTVRKMTTKKTGL